MSERMQREEYWHWFHGLHGVSQKEKEELLKLCPDVKEWYEAGRKNTTEELFETACLQTEKQKERKKVIQGILESPSQQEWLKKSYDKIKKENIKIVLRESKRYPERLKNIMFPPFVLYYYGQLPEEELPSLAVIGARNCSVYGEEIASVFSERLAGEGIQIVSGMARGIDAAAQRSAINQRGSAYAVLGSGVDICYPKENRQLYEELCRKGGVISEEVPGTQPVARNFPKRNRLISGLADAVFVVEAREKSGSLITVSYALEQGKEIYAIPGRIYEQLAEGTNRLIQEGAYLVREPEDILQGLQGKKGAFPFETSKKELDFIKKTNLLLETKEKIVYACLSLQPKHIEQICMESELALTELTSLLFDMEMKHYIKQPLKNYYIIQS